MIINAALVLQTDEAIKVLKKILNNRSLGIHFGTAINALSKVAAQNEAAVPTLNHAAQNHHKRRLQRKAKRALKHVKKPIHLSSGKENR